MLHRASPLLPAVFALALSAPALATETAPEPPPQTEAVDPAVVPPQIIAKTQKAPDYPPAARAARFDGTVHLSVKILADGSVTDAEVLECDHPNMGFEAASIAAAKQWKFVPARKDDQPIEYVTTFRINFRTGVGGGPGKVMIMAGSSANPADERQAGIVPTKVPPTPPPSAPKR